MPLIIRGPGVPQGPDGARPDLEHRLRADAGRLREREGRADDGRRLAAADDRATRASAPNRALGIEALAAAVPRATIPVNGWDRPYTGRAHRPLHLRRLHRDRRHELFDRKNDPYELHNLAGDPAYADVEAELGREDERARRLRRQVLLEDQALSGRVSAPGRIRTCDLRLRRAALYPAELRALGGGVYCGPLGTQPWCRPSTTEIAVMRLPSRVWIGHVRPALALDDVAGAVGGGDRLGVVLLDLPALVAEPDALSGLELQQPALEDVVALVCCGRPRSRTS